MHPIFKACRHNVRVVEICPPCQVGIIYMKEESTTWHRGHTFFWGHTYIPSSKRQLKCGENLSPCQVGIIYMKEESTTWHEGGRFFCEEIHVSHIQNHNWSVVEMANWLMLCPIRVGVGSVPSHPPKYNLPQTLSVFLRQTVALLKSLRLSFSFPLLS